MKRKAENFDQNAVKQHKTGSGSQSTGRKKFEAYGPSKPLPEGDGPLVFDQQMPNMPTRPDAAPVIAEMEEKQYAEFMVAQWTIVQDKFASRYNEEHRLALMGTHENHQTIAAFIDGIHPYFYAKLPAGGRVGPQHADGFRRDCEYDMRRFVQNLAKERQNDSNEAKTRKERMRDENDRLLPDNASDPFYVISVEYVEKLPVKGFTTQTMPMFKITCRNDKIRRKLARKLQKEGIRPTCTMTELDRLHIDQRVEKVMMREQKAFSQLRKEDFDDPEDMPQPKSRSQIYRQEFAKAIKRIPLAKFQPFEADLNFGVQLNTDLDLKVNKWVSFDNFAIIDFEWEHRWTDFQIEIHASVDDLVVHEPTGKYEKIAPIYQLSLDGEMRAMVPGFPSASESPVIQWGLSLRTDMTGPAYEFTGCLTQGPLKRLQDVSKNIASFTYEAGIHIAMAHAMSVYGIFGQLWVGWNTNEFDLPYFYERIKENFATEYERCYLILKRRGKTNAFIRNVEKVAKNAGFDKLGDMFAAKDVKWILKRLFPFPTRKPGESGEDLKARQSRNSRLFKDNFTTIQDLVHSIRKSRRARQTLADVGIAPPLSSPSGDGDAENFYWDLLCQLFPDWQLWRESGATAWTCLMNVLSPFRRGMATFRCQNANNAVVDAYNFFEPTAEDQGGNGRANLPEAYTRPCGKDSVFEANRMYQVYRSFESRAYGFMESYPTLSQGTQLLDYLKLWRKEVKRRGYGLKAVYEDVMKKKTAEVNYDLIPIYHQAALNTLRPDDHPPEAQSLDGNTVLTNYCAEDARAPLDIDKKKEFGLTYVELGRVTGVDIGDLADRGASIRSTMLIKAEAGRMNMVFPPRPPTEDDGSYQGAYVYEPLSNFYRQPVATLDFSSLYPSIIIAYNLCYSTIIELTEREMTCEHCDDPEECHYRADHDVIHETIHQAAERLGLGPEDYWKTPVEGVYTVKEHVRKGLLPRVCASLLAKRKVAKKHLKKAKAEKENCTNAIHDLLEPLKQQLKADYSEEELEALGLGFGKSNIYGLDDKDTLYAKAEAQGISTDGLFSVIETHGKSKAELQKLVDQLNDAVRRIPIYNGRQLSFKLCGNSIYGYTGSKTSLIPDRRIALAITTIGMNLILDSASVSVDHMKKGWWAPKTRDIRERESWLRSYFDQCLKLGIAPLQVKTPEQEQALRNRLRKGRLADGIEAYSPQDTRPLWPEPPCPFDMPESHRNNFRAQMVTQRERTRVLFKHAYDSKLTPEQKGMTEKQVKKEKAQKRKLAKIQALSYNCSLPPGFAVQQPSKDVSPMDTEPIAPSVSRLDARHPPLYRDKKGKAPNFTPQELEVINERFSNWSELCCWTKAERIDRPLSRDELFACVDTTDARDVEAAELFLKKFRTPGKFVTFEKEDLESFEPPYVYQSTAKVVYGDTDSVMVALGHLPLPMAHTVGYKLEFVLNIFFAPLITLVQEYEKVYELYDLREQKKRYTGSLFEPFSLTMKYIDAKGSEAARRDNCLIMVEILNTITEMMFVQKVTPDKVYDYVTGEFQKIYNGEYDISQFIISQKFSKAEKDYSMVPAHIRLVQKMRERDPASAPQVGSRVPYICVEARKGAKTSERLEDPQYALKHDIAPDYEHYIMEKFRNPIEGAVGRWMPANMRRAMFSRRFITQKKKRVSSAAAAMFGGNATQAPQLVIHNRCTVCNARAVKTHGSIEFPVCDSERCKAQIPELYVKAKKDLQVKTATAEEYWDICRKCVAENAPGLDIEQCSNCDCKYWFVRSERQRDAEKAKTHLHRIENCQTYNDLF
jgi:DNA polymerase elongation subunit (family B)